MLLEYVVKIYQATLAETHPNRLASQFKLARVYLASGNTKQMKDAVVMLELVVRIRETTLAETHPDLLVSQHELARAYLASR